MNDTLIQKFPCKECLVMPLCINKERVICKKLRYYLIGKEEPQRSIKIRTYTTLFKCDGATTMDDDQYSIIKVYKKGPFKSKPEYYVIKKANQADIRVNKKYVMRVNNND